MRDIFAQALASVHRPPPREQPWEWAAREVNFARVRSYETEYQAAYDPEFMPYWREPVEALTDRAVSEVWVIKASRAGASENILLNAMRYAIAARPQPILYISGQQDSVENFMERRIKLGMGLAEPTRQKYRAARSTEHRIMFQDCDLMATWPRNRMAFKQSGYSLVLADEVSTWPDFAADMLRRRTENWTFSTILGVSSPDPAAKRGSQDDPIFVEFGQTDQRYWYMPDPGGGDPFRFEMGSEDSRYGLKWPADCKGQDGEWDLDRVAAEAYYVTPGGTVLAESDRMSTVRSGGWVPTNENARTGRRGYHLNAFHLPWKGSTFGAIACAFLGAKRRGRTGLKFFVYEYLAEPFAEEIQSAEDEALYGREDQYGKGQRFSAVIDPPPALAAQSKVMMSVDVQADHLWYLVREWIPGGDSGLIDWGATSKWDDLDRVAEKYGVSHEWVDYAYERRSMDVFEYAADRSQRGGRVVVPVNGVGSISMPFSEKRINPWRGIRGGPDENTMTVYAFSSDLFKQWLMDMMRGETEQKWRVYAGIEPDYIRQVNSEQRLDGEWILKPGNRQNHLWDCEVQQLAGATILRLVWPSWLMSG